MKQKFGRNFITILAILALLFSVPNPIIDRLKSFSVYFVNPLPLRKIIEDKKDEEVQKLTVENQILRNEHADIFSLIEHQYALNSYPNLQKLHLTSKPARIIYRPANSWNHCFWIDKGSKKGDEVIAKGSIVVSGASVIGVIDYVGKYQSRVRMITDPALHPSVRVIRGDQQKLNLSEKIAQLLPSLIHDNQLLETEEKEAVIKTLISVQQRIQSINNEKNTLYLAKGELQGCPENCWRSHSPLLKGSGFNYDFSDEKGSARDLRTGESLENPGEGLEIIKEGDLLVTTGLDGVFPPGLNTAIVTKVNLLKEGDYFYDIEAKPTVDNLSSLTYVIVLPPVGFNVKDQPAAYE